MKQVTITAAFEQEKLRAVRFYLSKNGTTLEAELDTFLEKLYRKYVPSQTREYIESRAEPENSLRPQLSRAAKCSDPDMTKEDA